MTGPNCSCYNEVDVEEVILGGLISIIFTLAKIGKLGRK